VSAAVEAPPTPFGIVVSKDVMVRMRDGIRLATDLYRPASEGELVPGRYPTIVCITPYDKTERRYTEIADFFVPYGYAVVLQDLRDRHRSEGTKEYFHSATPHTGEDAYDTIEWIAAQPWSNGRTGMVGSSYAAIVQVRAALERPPHLTAIWPDVTPTNVYFNQTREGGAMQLHMFWALYIHAADAQEVTADWEKQREVWDDLRNLKELLWGWPWRRGALALRHVPALDETLENYTTRGAYDGWWAAKENDFTRFLADHADIPATISTGWFDAFPHAMSEYYAAMAAQNTAPQRLVVGPWSHVGMRGDVTYSHDVDFGEASRWGVQRYFAEQLEFFDRWLRGDGSAQAPAGAPVRIFVMGGGSGRRTAEGKLDHGGRWRDEAEWPPARAVPTTLHLHGEGALRPEPPPAGAEPRRFTYRPDDPVPTIGGLYCAVGELPDEGVDIEPMWARLLNPALRLRNIMTPGPADQRESAEYFTAREPFVRLSERPDVLVYQTEPLPEPLEVTGRVEVELWIASSALDTDFTAKLLDVHPPNVDYPAGYDMLLNDSIIRTRYREGFDREVLMEPGTPYPVRMLLPPTSNVFAAGHRIRIDVSSSNFPRLERNPNTGEPVGRHTHTVAAEQVVFSDAVRPSRVVLPVIPAG
jgi:putative CocE/NonD family hydrolase